MKDFGVTPELQSLAPWNSLFAEYERIKQAEGRDTFQSLCGSVSFMIVCKVVKRFEEYEPSQVDVRTFCKSILQDNDRQQFMKMKPEEFSAIRTELDKFEVPSNAS